jgi:flagellar FliJ protein
MLSAMAKTFKFNLQKVLDYRVQLEDQAKLALAKAVAVHQTQERLVRALEAAQSAHQEALVKAKSLTAADIWLWRNYQDRLTLDLNQSRIQERILAQDVLNRRAELVEKAKDRKLLDKLKEKQGIRHGIEESKKEQAGYDEMATLRHQPQAV